MTAKFVSVRTVCTACALFTTTALTAPVLANEPISLKISAPGGSVILSDDAKVNKKGKLKDKDPTLPGDVVLYEDGWTMTFRMESKTATDIVRVRESLGFTGLNYDILVLDDPDGCLDLTNSFPTALYPGNPPPDALETCSGGPDETTLTYVIDEFDAPAMRDTDSACISDIQDRLTDDPFGSVDYTVSNKTYVDTIPGTSTDAIAPVGVFTGGVAGSTSSDADDCYGYGVDEDAPSLVIMANVGGARVFDENLNYDNTRLRNMAGLISGVSLELLDGNGATALVAQMPIRERMLRPLTFVDMSETIAFTPYSGPVTIKAKLEDGPIETIATLPVDSTEAELVAALFDALPTDYEVEIRAVVVNGVAPEIIIDASGDGEFTAEDVAMMGYTLLSNEAVKTVRLLSFDAAASEEDSFECPAAPVFVDLDGDDIKGGCSDGDGTSRSRVQVPR